MECREDSKKAIGKRKMLHSASFHVLGGPVFLDAVTSLSPLNIFNSKCGRGEARAYKN